MLQWHQWVSLTLHLCWNCPVPPLPVSFPTPKTLSAGQCCEPTGTGPAHLLSRCHKCASWHIYRASDMNIPQVVRPIGLGPKSFNISMKEGFATLHPTCNTCNQHASNMHPTCNNFKLLYIYLHIRPTD